MNPDDIEGVIKYGLDFERKSIHKPLDLSKLIAWRSVLYKLKVIGQDPLRYEGLGFGNISGKLEQDSTKTNGENRFVISGTQTGATEFLAGKQFCIVTQACIRQNHISAEGLVKPSSEALTHASVYRCHPEIQFVMHVHSPDIWQATRRLRIPYTDKNVAYGTPEMARSVRSLIQTEGRSTSGIFSMLGHEDGIVAYSDSADNCGKLIINALVRSLSLKLDS